MAKKKLKITKSLQPIQNPTEGQLALAYIYANCIVSGSVAFEDVSPRYVELVKDELKRRGLEHLITE